MATREQFKVAARARRKQRPPANKVGAALALTMYNGLRWSANFGPWRASATGAQFNKIVIKKVTLVVTVHCGRRKQRPVYL